MKILLIFTLCLISDGGDSKEVTGYSGGVLIKCKYDTGYTQNEKYFCKGSTPGCSDQIKTDAKNKWFNSGRFSLYDDTKLAEFWVTIRELTVQDTGTYQCGVDIQSQIDIYTLVELKVNEDPSYEKFISETVHEGQDLNITYKYPESLTNKTKFLCKMGLQDSACSYDSSFNEIGEYVNMGKFFLYDNRETQTLSVSIRNVTERDSGEYWCGAEAVWESDDGYKVYFTQINLTVTGPHVPVSTWKPTQPSSSSSFELISASPPAGFQTFAVISVSVTLALLLIGVIFLIVVLQKRRRMRGETFFIGSSGQDGGNNREWAKYIRSSSASEQGTSADYCNMRPTIPSDPSQSIYANVM